ncbi:hypothetical protein [Paraburkholderia lacunae]|uniref:Phage tail protein n=1 Tax=Paraburkholderia lacunae TaxID=2211104 RepID=A0A370N792_9BURK|nr:hypothetical protein [Paraburkholderia lacunae]RDK01435.1 hypothetical protein DLM46_16530 [Paraburkholderia lacunae]
MAFKISKSETYQRQIDVVTVSESGRHEKENFKVTFRRCTNEQLDELRKKTGREVLQDVVAGWSGITDDDGSALPFNEENFEALLQIPAVSFALVKGFWDSIVVAQEKN